MTRRNVRQNGKISIFDQRDLAAVSRRQRMPACGWFHDMKLLS